MGVVLHATRAYFTLWVRNCSVGNPKQEGNHLYHLRHVAVLICSRDRDLDLARSTRIYDWNTLLRAGWPILAKNEIVRRALYPELYSESQL
jgi:hypothetical protein